jgi:hypothetical protein
MTMNSWLKSLSISVLIIALPSCAPEHRVILRKRVVFAPKNIRTSLDVSSVVERQPTITVWIHGTRLFYSAGALRNFHFSKPGLHLARDYESKYHMHQIGKTLVNTAPHLFSNDSFYIFGWSGKLNFGAREQSAELLYKELHILIEQYLKEHAIAPRIRIITHSHGGNVALNLARVSSKDPAFAIDELILLACPVQDQTVSLVTDPIFKKISCIYSQLDILQILDPQGLYKNPKKTSTILSGRYFPEQENLEQIKIKMNGRAIFHSEFVFPRFLAFLPDIIGSMDNWDQEVEKEKPFTKFMKMLHVRTDGKPFKFARQKHPIVT